MHPYDHARSSARIHGGLWQDYFGLHAWFDASKALQCRFTHRALRHHLEGVREALEIFGPVIRNRDGVKVPTQVLGLQHLEEDSPKIADAKDWLIDFDTPDWFPAVTPSVEDLARESAQRFGGDAENYLPLHGWFLATENWTAGNEHLVSAITPGACSRRKPVLASSYRLEVAAPCQLAS